MPRPTVGLVLVLGVLAWPGPDPAAAQSVLERTPNLEGGWTGSSGVLHLNVVHRFWSVGAGEDRKLVNSPTLLFGGTLPGSVLVAARYASNSLVAADRFNEWEFSVRRSLPRLEDSTLRGAVSLAWNTSATSLDGELALAASMADPGDGGPPRARLSGAVRVLGDAFGAGSRGWGLAGGAVLRLRPGAAIAVDAGRTNVDDRWEDATWGVGLQLRLPATPHTLSLQAANTRTSTLQGASRPGRTTWGFEFTVPVTLARYLPALRGHRTPDEETGRVVEGQEDHLVTMTDDMRFLPDTLRIRAGETVEWLNPTAVVHTVTAHPDRVRDPSEVSLPEGAEPFDSGNLFTGNRFRWRFEVPGTYRYLCIPHDMVGMVGVIVVDP